MSMRHVMNNNFARNNIAAFTLLELTVVLAIIAVVMGSAIALLSASLEGKSYSSTAAKLKILQQTLADYRIAYNRLPCPAASSLATTDANFGIAVATASPCTGADIADASAAVGMIPVRTLGLPDDMAVDSWGRRIRYAVDPDFVAANSFDSIAASNTTTRLTVNSNATGAAITTTAAFVLVSYGPNGHGGYAGALGSGTSARFNGGITNTNELLNCKCDNVAAVVTTTPATFVQGDPDPDPADALNNFDDLVMFATRADLRDGDE